MITRDWRFFSMIRMVDILCPVRMRLCMKGMNNAIRISIHITFNKSLILILPICISIHLLGFLFLSNITQFASRPHTHGYRARDSFQQHRYCIPRHPSLVLHSLLIFSTLSNERGRHPPSPRIQGKC